MFVKPFKTISFSKPVLLTAVICLAAMFLMIHLPNPISKLPLKIGVLPFMHNGRVLFNSFRDGLARDGFIDGVNIEYVLARTAKTKSTLQSEARNLIARDVDLVLAISTDATKAALMEIGDKRIPVVFAAVSDPLESDLVECLYHPGRPVTGVTWGSVDNDTEALRLNWLNRMLPELNTIYLLYDPMHAPNLKAMKHLSAAAAQKHIEIIKAEVRNMAQIRQAMTMVPPNTSAVFMTSSPVLYQSGAVDMILARAKEMKLPVSADSLLLCAQGALLSFGPFPPLQGEQAARLAAQILQGGDPSQLPVEIPQIFLAFNLRTAASIGLDIPHENLQLMDYIFR